MTKSNIAADPTVVRKLVKLQFHNSVVFDSIDLQRKRAEALDSTPSSSTSATSQVTSGPDLASGDNDSLTVILYIRIVEFLLIIVQ